MIRLLRYFHYLLRMPRTYGFGVQSPFAYRFIRQVVHGGNGFPCGDSLELLLSGASKCERRLLLVVLKLALYSHADTCFMPSKYIDSPFGKMLRGLHIKPVSQLPLLDKVQLAIVSTDYSDYGLLLDRMLANGVLLVDGIHAGKKSYGFWKLLLADKRTFVTFDLFDIGVIFFDPKMYKRNYRCNY